MSGAPLKIVVLSKPPPSELLDECLWADVVAAPVNEKLNSQYLHQKEQFQALPNKNRQLPRYIEFD